MRIHAITMRKCLPILSLIFLLPFFIPSQSLAHEKTTTSPVTTNVTVSHSAYAYTSNLQMSATHEQQDANSWNNPTAVASAKQLMQNALSFQNQHIMGWGADNPEPSPGVFNWGSLDARVQLMRDTNAQKVITLCAAPGWMRPAGYQDDWKDMTTAPDPSHVQDFANLAKAVALRYPDVKFFQVWNELKGMWSDAPGATPGISSQNRWDYKRYTTLYNAVYDAVKGVRPDAKLGGPYVVMDSVGNRSQMSNPGPSFSWGTLDQRPLDVLSYWLAHKHGADFIAVDGGSSNVDNVWPTSEFTSSQKFANVYNWIRLQPNGGTTLPIWWSEWYADSPATASQSVTYDNALMASGAIDTLASGANMLTIWQPEGDTNGFSFPEGLWTDTSVAGGGQPTPYYATSVAFKTYFGPGTRFYKTTVSSSNLAIAAATTKTMLVNRLPAPQRVVINGTSLVLNPYQVLLIDTP